LKDATLWEEWQKAKEMIESLESQLRTERVRERVLARRIFEAVNEVAGVVLSRRQAEVLKLLKSKPGGLSNKEIADELHVAERTVKFHISDLLRIYRVKNRAELIFCTATSNDEDEKQWNHFRGSRSRFCSRSG